MPIDLPRLKPDPIPSIHPIPEHAATGSLKEVYEATKRGLSVPWMGVVTMAFAHYPSFYDCLWRALEPVVATKAFAAACQALRQTAEKEAAVLWPSDLSKVLWELGYGERELDEIRACNEVFSSGNMPYLLIATLARLLLEGEEWSGKGAEIYHSDCQYCSGRSVAYKPLLIEPHHADHCIAALYQDIMSSLELPFVNTDYRAFARWPSYFLLAWQDLKPKLSFDDYERSVAQIHERAVELVQALPNKSGLTVRELRRAGLQDADLDEILSVVRLFQYLLPGLVLNVAYMRAQLR